MSWIEHKYATLMSSQLEQFKKRGNVYNFRCPECGDSQKNRFKARGYLIDKKDKLFYHCHNCSYSASFPKFLERFNPTLYREFTMESLKEHGSPQRKREEPKPDITSVAPPKFLKRGSPLRKLKKISQLKWDHPAARYIKNRKIPPRQHFRLFYCPDFAAWTDFLVPGFYTLPKNDKRIIIPFLDEEGALYGYQGRSLDPKSELRYITIMLDQREPKIYGRDNVNYNERVYMLEGPFDSLFLPNALAMAGSDLADCRQLNLDPDNTVVVYDNEPRNAEILKKIEKRIDEGYKVCIWPSNIDQKDVNEMILSGKRDADIKLIIDANTYKGLEAVMALSVWRKKCHQ